MMLVIKPDIPTSPIRPGSAKSGDRVTQGSSKIGGNRPQSAVSKKISTQSSRHNSVNGDVPKKKRKKKKKRGSVRGIAWKKKKKKKKKISAARGAIHVASNL